MSTPSYSKIYIASARLTDRLVKLGVPLLEQGVERGGVRCFVFEKRPEHTRHLRSVLGGQFK